MSEVQQTDVHYLDISLTITIAVMLHSGTFQNNRRSNYHRYLYVNAEFRDVDFTPFK